MQLTLHTGHTHFPHYNILCRLHCNIAYQNKFVETLNEIKLNQKKIIEQQLKNEVAMVGLDAKQDLIKDLTLDWLSFMDDVDALAAERSAGGE